MKRLETVTNIVLIIAAVAVAGSNIYGRFFSPALADGGASVQAARRLGGKPLPLPATLPVGRRATIALFMSKDCHFCRESMEFYRQLAAFASENNGCDVKLVAVGPKTRERREDLVSYLADQKLRVDGVDVADFPSLSISGTPTLALEDSSRLVRNVWVGLIPASQQNEVFARVKSLCR